MPSVADNSFLLFVYPFLFDAKMFDSRVEALDGAQWRDSKKGKEFNVWTAARFPGTDMLASVANYLNPEPNATATARLWKLNEDLQETFGLAGRADWQLVVGKDRIPFRLGEVGKTTFALQLAMFRVGTGFLTVRIKPHSKELGDWLDVLSYFRFIKGQRDVSLCAQTRVGFDQQTRQPQYAPFFPAPVSDSEKSRTGCGFYDDIVSALLRVGTLKEESLPWWREVFVPGQVLPFAALFVDDAPKADIPSLTYRLRNFFTLRQEIHPSETDLRTEHPSLLPYTDKQWFIFSLDGGAFLACDAPQTEFFRGTLSEHLRDHYFLLFLLALHQRFTLMNLSQQVSEHWLEGDDEARTHAFERIRETMLEFMARGRFTQVMQQEHHHGCYRKWLRVFQVHELYEEVRGEVSEMHSHLQAARERESQERIQHLEHRISSLVVLIGIPTLVTTFLTLTPEARGLRTSLAIVGGALAFGFVLLWILQLLSKRKSER
jgi:hypothetical protein